MPMTKTARVLLSCAVLPVKSSSFFTIAERLVRFAARPEIFFYLLIGLMILLAVGTVAQKYIGLYLAQKLYFTSFVVWFGGFVPFPGGATILTLVFVNLLCKLIVEKWTKKKLGTLVTHCGALLLLFGGFLTAIYSSEGFMEIEEGASSHFIEDYRQHELAFIDLSNKSEIVFDQKQLQHNQVLTSPNLPFAIIVETYCANCSITRRPEMILDGSAHGMLVANEMKPIPLSPDDAQNRAGLIFNVKGANKKLDGRYAIFEAMPIVQHLNLDKTEYVVTLRRQRTLLPFHVKLIKFDKQLYPGTDKPRAFQSEVIVQDGSLQWHSLISMNSPLRYKGYTFYQSSFIEGDGKPTTVLAVVKNIGAIFPYIASITLCLGLLIHLFLRIPQLKTKEP